MVSTHRKAAENADINTMDRVFDDIKDFFKFDAGTGLKDELWVFSDNFLFSNMVKQHVQF